MQKSWQECRTLPYAHLTTDWTDSFFIWKSIKIDLKTALINRQNTLPIHFQKLALNPLNHPCHHFLIKFFNLSLDPVGQPNEEMRLVFLSLTKFLHWQVSMRGWTNRIGCLRVRCRSEKSISHRAKWHCRWATDACRASGSSLWLGVADRRMYTWGPSDVCRHGRSGFQIAADRWLADVESTS